MARKYRVVLTPAQRQELRAVLTSGKWAAHSRAHAHLLLKADAGPEGPNWPNAVIATAFETSEVTIWRVCKRFAEQGLEAALQRKPQTRHKPRKLDGAQEARLLALACSTPPEGRQRWTLRLLADRFVELGQVDDLSHETVRQVLKGGAQALAAAALVHPDGREWGVRSPHGRPAGALPCPAGPPPPLAVFGRDAQRVARGATPAVAAVPGEAGPGRL